MNADRDSQQQEERYAPAAPQVHLRDYIAIVLRHLKLVMAIVAITLLLGGLHVWSAKQEYEAITLVRVGGTEGPEEIAGSYAGYMGREKELSTYCHIIKSSDLARSLVQKLGINSYQALGLSMPKPGLIKRAKDWIVERIPTSRTEGASDAGELEHPRYYAAKAHERIDAEVLEGTNLIQISYTAEDRYRASEICQAVANLFIEEEHERRLDSAKRWMKWLRTQLAEFQAKAEQSEEKLLEFHDKVDTYVTAMEHEKSEGLPALQSTIETLRGRRAQVRVERIELAIRLQMLEGLSGKDNPVPAHLVLLDNPAIDRLLQGQTEVRRELALKRMRYGPKYREIRQLEESLALVAKDIDKEAKRALEALKEKLESVKAQEEKLAEEIEEAERKAAEINKGLIEYSALRRKADANWRFFDTFITKAEEADLATSIESVNIDLISKAPEVRRAPSHAVRTMVLCLFLGLVVGVGLALFLDYMDTSVATPADVQRTVGIDQLGVLVHAEYRRPNKAAPIVAARDAPASTLTENFRNLRASVLYSPRFRDVRLIVVTSSVPREGKTTVATNLAIMLARAGKKALLVDGDMRRPATHDLFALDKEPGLSDFLSGKKGFEEILHKPDVENMCIIAAGTRVENPAELLGSSAGKLAELARRVGDFDYVIFDSPPLTLSDPTLLVKSLGGTALLVLRSGAVTDKVVQNSVSKLHAVEAYIGGVVLNNFDVRKQGYYGYGYRYYRYYYYYPYYHREPQAKGGRDERTE